MNGDKKQKTESGLKCVRQVFLQGVTGDPIVFDSTQPEWYQPHVEGIADQTSTRDARRFLARVKGWHPETIVFAAQPDYKPYDDDNDIQKIKPLLVGETHHFIVKPICGVDEALMSVRTALESLKRSSALHCLLVRFRAERENLWLLK